MRRTQALVRPQINAPTIQDHEKGHSHPRTLCRPVSVGVQQPRVDILHWCGLRNEIFIERKTRILLHSTNVGSTELEDGCLQPSDSLGGGGGMANSRGPQHISDEIMGIEGRAISNEEAGTTDWVSRGDGALLAWQVLSACVTCIIQHPKAEFLDFDPYHR